MGRGVDLMTISAREQLELLEDAAAHDRINDALYAAYEALLHVAHCDEADASHSVSIEHAFTIRKLLEQRDYQSELDQAYEADVPEDLIQRYAAEMIADASE